MNKIIQPIVLLIAVALLSMISACGNPAPVAKATLSPSLAATAERGDFFACKDGTVEMVTKVTERGEKVREIITIRYLLPQATVEVFESSNPPARFINNLYKKKDMMLDQSRKSAYKDMLFELSEQLPGH